ncbi:MAG: Hpt domain-containing protein, partial [Lachnospiraceae bacterium]|nr:Hpt domain-containing protein [Lachnospiraceae bacterium]
HSIKSSARIIGAGHLSQLSESMEAAAEKKDYKAVCKYHDELTELCERIMKIGSRADAPDADSYPNEEGSKESTQDPLTKEVWDEAMRAVYEFALSMDYKNCEYVISAVEEKQLTKEMKEKIKALKDKLFDLDWDGVRVLAEMKG